MKLRFLLMLFAVLIAANAISQHGSGTAWLDKLDDPTANFYEIVAAADSFYSNADSADIQNFPLSPKHFGYWHHFWRSRLDSANGTRIKAFDAARDVFYDTNYCTTNPSIPLWSELGPDAVAEGENPGRGVGYIEEAWIKPSNHNIMIIGTAGGGIFKTTNGGSSWTDIMSSTRIPGVAVRALEVNPFDENDIYASIGDKGYGLGLIRTSDGGTTWEGTALTKDPLNNYEGGIARRIVADPSTFIDAYAVTKDDFYRTGDGFQSAAVLASANTGEEWLSLTRNPSGNVFASTKSSTYNPFDPSTWNNTPRKLIKYSEGTSTTTDISQNLDWSHPFTIAYTKLLICTATDRPNYIYALQERVDTIGTQKKTYVKLYTSTDNGSTFTLEFEKEIGGILREDFAASLYHNQTFYVSGPVLAHRITKNGTSWSYDQSWSNAGNVNATNYAHADVRDIDVFVGASNDIVYWSTDGGLFKAINNQFENVTEQDLCIWIVNGFVDFDASTEIFCGVYHGGNNRKDRNDVWRTISGGDGGRWAASENGQNLIGGVNASIARFNRQGSWFQGQQISVDQWWLFVGAPVETYFGTKDSFLVAGHDLLLYDWSLNQFVDTLADGYLIRDVKSCEGNGQVIVFSNSYDASDSGALFKTTNGGQTWSEISTNLNVPATIKNIFIHPNNPDEIWIGFDGFIPSERVYATFNGGATWINKSNNLSIHPVNDFAYDAVADILYAATDFGVYYLDKSVSNDSWHCYYKNLPTAYVSEIDVNYCTKKLIASTAGRGFHHVDLYQLSEHTNPTITLADTTLNINTEYYSAGSINISGTVTIQGAIYMNEDAKIYVPPGAKLIVDGGMITNSCGGLWGGIVAWGDNHSGTAGQKPFPQSMQNKHGIVTLKNNALLENAHTAVCLGREDMNFRKGGIINATNSEFRNNYQSIKFLSYHNYLPVSPYSEINNVSTIKDCQFISEGKLDDSQLIEPYAQITMHDVKGLHIKGCTFEDNTSWASSYRLSIGRIGIKSYDAIFSLDPVCSIQQYFNSVNTCWNQSGADSNTFSGYQQAVSVENWNSISPVTVRGVKFENNKHALVMWGGDMAEVYKNDFIHDGPSNVAAMTLIGSTGYFVEENNFLGMGSYYGLIVGHSGSDENEVRNNYFEELSTAAQFQGGNDGAGNYDGFEYRCNEMVGTTRDASVYGGDISKFQGRCDQTALDANSLPANNDFSSSCNSTSHYDVNKPSNQNIYYAHLTGEAPICYSNDLILNNCGGFNSQGTDRCPLSEKANPSGYLESSSALEQLVAGRIQLIDSISDTLDFRIINDAPNNQLVNDMLNVSPLLKDETLILAISAKPTPIPDNDLLDILYTVAPLTEPVDSALNKRKPALCDNVDDYVSTNGIVISPRTGKELEMSGWQRQIKRYHEEALRYWLVYDSTGNGWDSALTFLQSKEGEYYRVKEARLLMRKGDLSAAGAIVDDLNTNYNGDRHLDEFIEWADLALALEADSNGVFSIETDSVLEQQVRNLADTNFVGHVNYHARGLLSLVFNEPQNVLLPVDDMGSPKRNAQWEFFMEFEETNRELLAIHPNPASDKIIVEYRLPDEVNDAMLYIYSAEGKQIGKQKLNSRENRAELSVVDMKDGIYVYMLSGNGKFIARRKLVVSKN